MLRILRYFAFIPLAAILIGSFAACGTSQQELSLEYLFGDSAEGWSGDFVDLPVNYDPAVYRLEFAYSELPLGDGDGLKLSGSNASDDLFMFIKKGLTAEDGLKPNTTYEIYFRVTFLTSAPAGAIGIGGAPGEAVVVKVGASPEEPVPVVDSSGGDYYRLIIDKGNQNNDGANGVRIGNVAKEQSDDFDTWESKTLDNAGNLLAVTTDDNGDLWLLIGTDSGFEGVTTIYFTNIQVTLQAV